MAYINRETSAKIRKALKEAFPEIKFSVSIENQVTLNVRLMASPYFDDGVYTHINHHWMSEHFEGEQLDVLQRIERVIKEVGEWFDKSDVMTDYFHTAFYYRITLGRWDKPHVNTAQEVTA